MTPTKKNATDKIRTKMDVKLAIPESGKIDSENCANTIQAIDARIYKIPFTKFDFILFTLFVNEKIIPQTHKKKKPQMKFLIDEELEKHAYKLKLLPEIPQFPLPS